METICVDTKTMIVNVAQLLKEPVGSTRRLDLSGDEELEARGDMELMRTDEGVLVRGRVFTEVETSCSRCLAPFDCPVSLDIEEEFLPTFDVISGLPLPPPEDPDAFTIDDHHILDLHEAVRQYALLALPMKALCRQDCAGLCPECGHNLNEGTCSCPPSSLDPRWARLEQLILEKEVPARMRDTSQQGHPEI